MIFFLDELIRQITINCAERGLLLLRVRYVYINVCIDVCMYVYACASNVVVLVRILYLITI